MTTTIETIIFAGAATWPLWAAQDMGYFADNGLTVNLTATPSSKFQMTNLINGEFDMATTAIDNIIAYREGQAEVALDAPSDVIGICGGHKGFLRLVVQPDIESYADLRGKSFAVDSPDSGYVYVLHRMLELNGIGQGDYTLTPEGGTKERFDAMKAGKCAGTLLSEPFGIAAEAAGLRILNRAEDVLGDYQGSVGAVRRAWAEQHRAEVVGFIRAQRAALDWLFEPANKDAAVHMLVEKLGQTGRAVPMEQAARNYDVMLDPEHGIDRAAAISEAGIRTVLELRNRYATPKKELTDAAPYYDLSYYREALS